MRRLVMVWAVVVAGCGSRPDCDRDPVVDDEPSIVEIGLVEVCPGDELRFRSADELWSSVWLSSAQGVRVHEDRYMRGTRRIDVSPDVVRVSLEGPCYDATLEAFPRPDAYDELVLSLPLGAPGGWVEIVDLEELYCMNIANQPPQTGGL